MDKAQGIFRPCRETGSPMPVYKSEDIRASDSSVWYSRVSGPSQESIVVLHTLAKDTPEIDFYGGGSKEMFVSQRSFAARLNRYLDQD